MNLRRVAGGFSVASASVTALAVSMSTFPVAQADELEDLIAQTEQISRDATAKSEEVKQLEDEVAAKQSDVDRLRVAVDQARSNADAALQSENEYRAKVNELSGAKYRGLTLDSVTHAMGASDPQNAIDRAAYMNTLSRDTQRTIAGLSEATTQAAKAHSAAARAQATAEFQQGQLHRKLDQLKGEQAELEAAKAEVQARVDALTEDQRAAWVGKNNPLDPAALSSLVEGAQGAVAAALSKQGAPYEWGAAGPDRFDCSGLIYWAYQQQGKTIPRTSQAQVAGGTPVSRDQLQPGDVVGFYPGVTHVGLYIGNGQVVHASDYGIPVQVVSVDSMPFAGAARY